MTKRLLFEGSAPVGAAGSGARADRLGLVLDSMIGAEARDDVDIDHTDGTVGFQGHWWYRGEIAASAGDDGVTRLSYRVYNVARRAPWAVPLANRFFVGYEERVRRSATDLAAAVERRLAGARP